MRIIAGEMRGRRLAAPKGDGTRPTTDRVREALFSSIASARGGFEGAAVLDAFAGSGALACEALSRGAAFACLCEHSGAAARVIERNLADLGLDGGRARLVRGDVLKGVPPRPPASAGAAYDLVLLDPPYALSAAEALGVPVALDDRGLLQAEAIVSYEHDAADEAAVDAAFADLLEPRGFRLAKRKTFGGTAIDLFRR